MYCFFYVKLPSSFPLPAACSFEKAPATKLKNIVFHTSNKDIFNNDYCS
ncbi:hypothetical protein HMPREF3203_02820 [Proteus mirabilis]|nr:hypothetical protein HMPREF3203_02820 [Proteus mirabilis]